MDLAPHERRTYFITSTTWERRSILQSHRLCELLLEVIRVNRAKGRFLVHEFVFMRDHIHLILTPAPLVPLDKAVQFIKGGFSFRAKKENLFNGEIWQKSFHENAISDADEYARLLEYLWMNPVKACMVERPEDFAYSSARLRTEVDAAPLHFQRSAAATTS